MDGMGRVGIRAGEDGFPDWNRSFDRVGSLVDQGRLGAHWTIEGIPAEEEVRWGIVERSRELVVVGRIGWIELLDGYG